jgi:sulfur-carrier protein adenylyltransferase/sulfurtransferase
MFENLKRFFAFVESFDPDESKAYLAEHEEGSFTLLDVRQPGEYQQKHIPGAKLIPITLLPESIKELDPEKPVLVYCAIGGRSRVASQMLAGRGLKQVYNMRGGIQAWEGPVADGPVELNLDLVRGDETPQEIIKLAYGMEQSLGDFYRAVKATASDEELASLLEKLVSIEDKHKKYLLDLYNSIETFPVDQEAFEAEVSATVMEGGFDSAEFMRNNERYLESVPSLLDLSMMLEAQALDLYLRFAEKVQEEEARNVLRKIGDEERAHLEALGRLREKAT